MNPDDGAIVAKSYNDANAGDYAEACLHRVRARRVALCRILVAVLSAAAKSGSPLQSMLSMVLYALGYTAILFFAALSAEIAVTSRRLLEYGATITGVAAAALVLVGLGMAWFGLRLL